jgi:signal transduction histidine kinase
MPFSAFDKNTEHLFTGISDGSRRINEIVNNLKEYSRADRIEMDREVNINQVVTSAVNMLHYQLMRHTERFHVDLDESIPSVRGSSQQLVQVVTNLVMNACQALPDKQCGIWVATGYDAATGLVTLTVRDEGQGMPETISSRALEPFFTTRLDSGGTGLGLFITQSIIREHDGSLEFTSEAGRGTTFIARIPAARHAAEEHQP